MFQHNPTAGSGSLGPLFPRVWNRGSVWWHHRRAPWQLGLILTRPELSAVPQGSPGLLRSLLQPPLRTRRHWGLPKGCSGGAFDGLLYSAGDVGDATPDTGSQPVTLPQGTVSIPMHHCHPHSVCEGTELRDIAHCPLFPPPPAPPPSGTYSGHERDGRGSQPL